jgi:ABC-type transporter Mla MlaB component
MSANDEDIAAVDPALVLSVDSSTVLRCAGTLDSRTRPCLVDAVTNMLRDEPSTIAVDIEKLRLADSAAANALTQVQRIAKDAGAAVHWRGLRADHLRMAPTLRAGAHRAVARRA